jgi:hypothetical protein
MLDGYDNRMLSAPRFVREGNRLIPQSALVTARIEVSAVDASQCSRCRRYVLKGDVYVCVRCARVLDEAGARR